MKIITIGYSGRTATQIADIIRETGGAILDIRLSAKSRRAEWSKKRLKELLGESYFHLWEWGNLNYKGGPIEIADFPAGLMALEAIEAEAIADNWDGPIFLMCVCSDANTCHRRVVGEMLAALGHDVEEYGK